MSNAFCKTIEHDDTFGNQTPGYWENLGTIKKLNNIIEQRVSNQVQLQVKESNKKDWK